MSDFDITSNVTELLESCKIFLCEPENFFKGFFNWYYAADNIENGIIIKKLIEKFEIFSNQNSMELKIDDFSYRLYSFNEGEFSTVEEAVVNLLQNSFPGQDTDDVYLVDPNQ